MYPQKCLDKSFKIGIAWSAWVIDNLHGTIKKEKVIMSKKIRIRFTVAFDDYSLCPEVKTNISSTTPWSVSLWQKEIYDLMREKLLEQLPSESNTGINPQQSWTDGAKK